MKRVFVRLPVGALVCALLAACGGPGGDDYIAKLRGGAADTATPVATATATATIAPTSTTVAIRPLTVAYPTDAPIPTVPPTMTPAPTATVTPVRESRMVCATMTVEPTQRAVGVVEKGTCWTEVQP